jgi:hypothetical protein
LQVLCEPHLEAEDLKQQVGPSEQYIPIAGVLGPDQRLQQLVKIALDAFAQDEAMVAREFAGVVTTPQDQVVGLGDDNHFLMVAATRHRGSVL